MVNPYLQNEIRTASPEALVVRLYERAILCAREARELTEAQQAETRNARLRRALDIVNELRSSLDMDRGGEIAANLDALYEFVSHRLLAAGMQSEGEPIEDALRILEILVEPWREIAHGARAAS
ncbi:MAG: flagellar export chaperone FliS [Myxococcota bacterium]